MPDIVELPALLPAEAVGVHAGVISRRGAIAMLSELMQRGHGLSAVAVAAAMHAREAETSTAFGSGVAIPHGHLPDAPGDPPGRIRGALLILHTPVDWNAPDGQPVDIVAGLAGAEGTPMLKALARMCRALRDPVLVAKMRGAVDAHALWSLIALQEAE